ncbi:MAG: DUF357 domain-containing protein [Candidatus Diapherotrites archaeon]|nr:DUF357 domain-containing protein [Candidatus Diapherotrites archaeon]
MSKQKYELCLRLTEDALRKLEVVENDAVSKVFLRFARNYYDDAKHYASRGEYATALEAIAYAHGFIDAGVLAGKFLIDGYHLRSVKR